MPEARETVSWLLEVKDGLSAGMDPVKAQIRQLGQEADAARAKIKQLREEQQAAGKGTEGYAQAEAQIKSLSKALDENAAKTKAVREAEDIARESAGVWKQNLLATVSVIGALTVGVGAAVTAITSFSTGAIEANKHLKEIGVNTGEAGKNVEHMAASIGQLANSWDKLKVDAAGSDLGTSIVSQLRTVVDYADQHMGTFSTILRVWSALQTGGISELQRGALGADAGPSFDAVGSMPNPMARLDALAGTDPTIPAWKGAEYGPSLDVLINGRTQQFLQGDKLNVALGARLDAEAFAASQAMRTYAITAPNSLAGGLGFLGANTQNPYASGDLGAGLSYHPLLQQPGPMGLQLPTLASPTMQLAASIDRNTAVTEANTLAADEAAKAARAASAQQGAGALAAGLSGGGVGGVVGAAAGGPVGMVASAVIGALPHLRSILKDLFDETMSIYTDLPNIIGGVAQTLVPALIRAAPEMAAAYIGLGPELVAELAKAGPEVFRSVVDAILSTPKAFADEMKEFVADVVDAANPFNDGFHPFGNHGGHGANTGVAKLGPVRPGGGRDEGLVAGRRGGDIHNHFYGGNEQDMARRLRKILGSYGQGYTLDSLVTP